MSVSLFTLPSSEGTLHMHRRREGEDTGRCWRLPSKIHRTYEEHLQHASSRPVGPYNLGPGSDALVSTEAQGEEPVEEGGFYTGPPHD